jgi:hypothetical protein
MTKRIAVGTLLLVGAVSIAGCSGDEASDGEGACSPGVTVDGKEYVEVRTRDLERSDALPRKGISACADAISQSTEPDRGAIALVSLKEVDTRVAVAAARPGPGGGVFVIEGRCNGFRDAREITECIQNPVHFRGDVYVGVKLSRRLTTDEPVGVGEIRSRTVRVWKLTDIQVEHALAIDQKPRQIYVQVNRCNLPGLLRDFEDKLIRCLSSEPGST